jgi:hypothetical protein
VSLVLLHPSAERRSAGRAERQAATTEAARR